MKKKNLINTSFKILIGLICIFLLVKTINFAKILDVANNVRHLNSGHLLLLLAGICFLLILNLVLETTKWHLFTYQYGCTLFGSFKQVIGGIAGGLISPNRIGDPFTRCYMLPNKFRIRGLLPATFCSFSQLLATAIFGSIALIHIGTKTLPGILKLALSQLIIILLIIVLIAFAMRFFENRVGKIRFSKAILVVALSLIRYFVFCTELWLIFLLFAPHVLFEPMFFAIALTFLANSAIPSFSFTELGVRATGAAIFFPIFNIDANIAVMATILLWVFNMVIPSIPGMILLFVNGISLTELKSFKSELLEKGYDIVKNR